MERLENEYAYACEVNLATLEELCLLKSSSKSRIARQRSICLTMLRVCSAIQDGPEAQGRIDFGTEDTWHPNGRKYTRVNKLLKEAQSALATKIPLEDAVGQYVQGLLAMR